MSDSEDDEVILVNNGNFTPDSRFRVDKKFINVITLGLIFMFVFTAFQTCAMIEVCIIFIVFC